MKQVSGFVKENREILGSNIKGLNRVAKVLVKQRDALDEILHGRAGRAEQPRADLQPAGRHARHPRQPRRARQPDHQRPGDVPVRHRQPGRPGRPGLQRDQGRAREAAGPPRCPARHGRRRRASAEQYRPDPRRPRGGRPDDASPRRRSSARGRAARRGAAALPAATSTSTSCRCPAAPTSATTRSRCTSCSATCWTWCPQSTVKVNDVSVGKVTDVALDGYTRGVTVAAAQRTSSCPTTPSPTIRQTSLLGEKFVSLAAPPTRREREPARRRRRDPARAHRPQPRGRGGARRAEPAAQRRRRRAS